MDHPMLRSSLLQRYPSFVVLHCLQQLDRLLQQQGIPVGNRVHNVG